MPGSISSVFGLGSDEDDGKKNPPANAGDIRDVGLICGSGRSPGGGLGNPLLYSTWRITWTEEPGRL